MGFVFEVDVVGGIYGEGFFVDFGCVFDWYQEGGEVGIDICVVGLKCECVGVGIVCGWSGKCDEGWSDFLLFVCEFGLENEEE